MDRDLARLLSSRRKCRCCGSTFCDLLSLEYDRPDGCPPELPKLDNSVFLMERGDVLTEDLCRVGEHRFIRAVLVLPLGEGEHEMVIGVWCAISPVHFDQYLDMMDDGPVPGDETFPAWMSNAVPPDGNIPLACQLHLLPGDQRPEVELTEKGHDLTRMQKTGMSFTDVLGLIYRYNHDLASLLHDS